MHVGDTERGYAANEQGRDNAAEGNGEPLAIDGGEHLASDDAADDAPSYLQNDVEDAGDLGRPVAHEVSTEYLLDKMSRSAGDTGSRTMDYCGTRTMVRFPLAGPTVDI